MASTDAEESEPSESALLTAARSGDIDAMCELGVRYDETGRWDEAYGWFEKAHLADPAAHAALTGLGMVTANIGETQAAEEWFEKAHAAGSLVAARNRGFLAMGEEDTETAERWFRGGVERGDGVAMRMLACILLAPVGTGLFPEAVARGPNAESEGRDLLKAAIEAGDVRAAYFLACFLESQHDWDHACAWYAGAADAGDEDARQACARLGIPVQLPGR